MNAKNDSFKSQEGLNFFFDLPPLGSSQRIAVKQKKGVDPCLASPDDFHSRSF
jgi:hypothetical protein